MYNEKMGVTPFEIEGPSLDDCKSRLYRTYGNSYQIVNQKTELKRGFLGFGQHEIVKISYIVNTKNPPAASGDYSSSVNGYSGMDNKDAFTRNRDEFLKKADPSVTSNIQLAQLSKKLDKLNEVINDKLDTISEVTNVKDKHPVIKKIEELLEANEFTASFINMISDRIRNEFNLEEIDDFEKVQSKVIDWIGEGIPVEKPVYFRPPHVIIVVGPTGVGKTTTVAKIAANLILDAKKQNLPVPNIRMVTIDMMRVGATIQLERYGEIMGVPVDKAESTEGLKAIFDEFKGSLDYLIIDTSGFSPNDYENIGKMRSELEIPGLHPDVFLAVSAEKKARDIEKILTTYEPFNYRSVILTKCDETNTYGNALSVIIEKQKSLSWLTNGQSVPYCIEKASKIFFLTRLIDFTVDRQHIDELFNPKEKQES